jgi:hypothetical protein
MSGNEGVDEGRFDTNELPIRKGQQCADCRWWNAHSEVERIGTCWRNPPVATLPGDLMGRWPVTFKDDTCGRFTPKA